MAPTPALQRYGLAAVAAAVILAGLAAALVIVRLTDEPPRRAAAPETILAPPLPEGRPAAPAEPAAVAVVPSPLPHAEAPPAPPPPHAAPPEEPQPTAWENIPPMARASAPQVVAVALGRGLEALQPAIAQCWGEEAARAESDDDDRVAAHAAVPIFLLHVETEEDQLRIEDPTLEAHGAVSDAFIQCAQRALVGQVFEAPNVEPGQRYRIRHRVAR